MTRNGDPQHGACLILCDISTQTFLHKDFGELSGSWTSTPKIMDVRAEEFVFLRARWWGETL